MSAKTGRFGRADRILRSRDFKRVVESGQRLVSRSFVVITAPEVRAEAPDSVDGRHRLGITVSKRVGNAVVRNRVKRRIREWFRIARAQWPGRSETVVIARPNARNLSGTEVVACLDRAIERRGRRAVAGSQ